jgi:NADH dehydrogenase FAD-containing subunit
MKSHYDVIVIGGGFGGVYATRKLLRAGLEVLLISEHNHFTFTPLLHEVATGNLSARDVTFEYGSFFKNRHFCFLRDTVTDLDPKRKYVRCGKRKINFNYVIVATGSTTNYFGMKGTEHVHVLKTLIDALELKKRMVELAQGPERNVDVAVIGGGPTGMELVIEMQQFLTEMEQRECDLKFSVTLIQSGPAVLGMYPERVQRYGERVLKKHDIKLLTNTKAREVTSASVHTTKGRIQANLTVLAAGVAPRTAFAQDSCNERNHLNVNAHLQLEGYRSVFAIGDIIVQNQERIPKLAQTATRQGLVAADNIIRLKKKKVLRGYSPNLKGTMVSLGWGRGAAVIGPLIITGFIGWWMWRTVYLFKTPGLRNKLEVAFSWTIDLFTGKNLVEH